MAIEKGQIGIFYVSLKDSNGDFVTNPTLASGDVTVILDGTSLGNIDSLPTVTPSGGTSVKVTLSAAETNGDNIVVMFSDQAGSEWVDTRVDIQTYVSELDKTVGSGKTLKQHIGYQTAVLAGTISDANTATETYQFDGFTVTVTVDSSGNRSATVTVDP